MRLLTCFALPVVSHSCCIASRRRRESRAEGCATGRSEKRQSRGSRYLMARARAETADTFKGAFAGVVRGLVIQAMFPG